MILAFLFIKNMYAKNALDQDAIELIGKNIAIVISAHLENKWDDVEITNVVPLYSFDEKLVAYSIDIRNLETNENGYVIFGTMKDDEPIIEFSLNSFSPYYDFQLNDEKICIYDEVLCYYIKEEGKKKSIVEINSNTELKDDEIVELIKGAKEKTYKSEKPENSMKVRMALQSTTLDLNGLQSINDTSVSAYATATSKIISGVADYRWRKGCVPTCADMVLNYHYPTLLPSGNVLIDQLAVAMNTTSTGSTSLSNILTGIKKVGLQQSTPVSITVWNDGAGRSASTFSEYVSEMNSYNPVLIMVIGSTATAPSYPNGFKDHELAGVGYSTYYGNYLIVHDTGCDGDVYVNFDSSSLGTNYWSYVH